MKTKNRFTECPVQWPFFFSSFFGFVTSITTGAIISPWLSLLVNLPWAHFLWPKHPDHVSSIHQCRAKLICCLCKCQHFRRLKCKVLNISYCWQRIHTEFPSNLAATCLMLLRNNNSTPQSSLSSLVSLDLPLGLSTSVSPLFFSCSCFRTHLNHCFIFFPDSLRPSEVRI